MMTQLIRRLVIIWILVMLFVMPAAAQDSTPQPDSNTPLDWLTVIIENDLHWYIFALIGLFVAGNLVPQEEIARRRERARQTETKADDAMVSVLEGVQLIKQMLAGQNIAGLSAPVATPPFVPGGSYVDEARRLNLPQTPPVIYQPSPNQSPLNPPATQGEIKPTIKVIRQELNVPVNENPKLFVGAAGHGQWDDKRAKDKPDGYTLGWQPLMAGDKFAAPPEIHRKDNGLDVAMAHRRGRLFIGQGVTGKVMPGQRYLLAARLACDLKLKADADIKGAIAVKAQLLSNEAVVKNLSAWSPDSVEDLKTGFEALWAIETDRAYGNLSYQVLIEIGNVDAVPFDDLSKVIITAIELVPVAADYGNENLVRF